MNKFAKLLGYDPVEKQTSVRTELTAGVVTFLAMAYILTVNPAQILVGADAAYWPSVFIATALGAIIGTLLMAFLAKMPLAQASGMGLNSLLGGLVALWAAGTYGVRFTLGQAFMMVLISGVLVLALTLIKIKGKSFRELVFDGMPVAVRGAISVGIGLFIAYIGFQNAGVIVHNAYTQVGFVDLTNWGEQIVNVGNPASYAAKTAVVALIGLFLIAILDKLKGSVIIGILGATIVGIPFGVTDLSVLAGNETVSWKFWENFANFFAGDKTVFGSCFEVFKTGLVPEGGSVFTVIMVIITMCMIDMFDTMGTIVGCCGGNRVLSDENNKPHNYDKIMISDAVATCAGAMLGTSTVTTFVESGAGVSAGGRTGLTALTTGILFLACMFIAPIAAIIPAAATSAALIYVGVLMLSGLKNLHFDDMAELVPAAVMLIGMPVTGSIGHAIGLALISYTVIKLCTGKVKEVSWLTAVISLIFLVKFFVTA